MAESAKIGYYTRDTGQHIYRFFMGAEPPLEQYILIDGKWEPLSDPWYLMDLVIDGNPELTGPVKDPGVLPPGPTKIEVP